ncbi:hypothetical protein A3K63_01805 [Candidatus Micrarchaeota archaeon RBG_16_49_10]|nr:MAG: hypothetical protein A3K63_01805 [Candidatus Micrarchaeota archaeon RBG_16_49_10]
MSFIFMELSGADRAAILAIYYVAKKSSDGILFSKGRRAAEEVYKAQVGNYPKRPYVYFGELAEIMLHNRSLILTGTPQIRYQATDIDPIKWLT